jgi:AraC-like DNA-binding protein
LEESDTRSRRLRGRLEHKHNCFMHGSEFNGGRNRIAPSALTASAVADFFVDEVGRERQLVALPRPEIQLVVRFGPSARDGLDVHALGMHQKVRRKLIGTGQRAVTARFHLGASKAVLGVPASAIAGRIVALDELWGNAAVQRLLNRLASADGAIGAAAVVESAIAERLAIADARCAFTSLALKAAPKLVSASVRTVAVDLGVSERHLRRVFRETVGVTPKAFNQLARFHRAVRAAREDSGATWAGIAAASGYYDQAHLIGEFRAIAGVTPRALLGELGVASRPAT